MSRAFIYRLVTTSISPLIPLWLRSRAAKGKEDKSRLSERYGAADIARPDGQLFWMHGASVGEAVMLLPLIGDLLAQYPKAHILVTSGTVSSAQILSQRLPERALHQYAPLDRSKWVRRFLAHWQPNLAIWAESEIWPNLVMETHKQKIPMALINARMSETSLAGWRKRMGFARRIFGCFDYLQAADDSTAKGLSSFTQTPIANFGNLKDAAYPLPVDKDELAAFTKAVQNRPVWCAASTHVGEDEIILRAHGDVLKTRPNALLILAPRHPERAGDILALAQSFKRITASRSEGETIQNGTQIYMMDTIGDMGLAYGLASITLMCGSMREYLFGHNPLEPARQNNAVLTGPHVKSFQRIYEDMFAFGAAEPILDVMDLSQKLNALFKDETQLRERQSKAYDFAQSRNTVLPQTLAGLSKLINDKAAL